MQHRSNYLQELTLQYDKSKLKQELVDLELEPYFKDNPNTHSWFAGPETWLYADVVATHDTELDSVCKQLKQLLGTDDFVFAIMRQLANSEVPVHHDRLPERIMDMYPDTKPIKCAVNIQLNDTVGPVNFPAWGSLETYRCALLNVMEDHGVPAFGTDRFFIKFKILDITYQEALTNYKNNKEI